MDDKDSVTFKDGSEKPRTLNVNEPGIAFERTAALAVKIRGVCLESGLGPSDIFHALNFIQEFGWTDMPLKNPPDERYMTAGELNARGGE